VDERGADPEPTQLSSVLLAPVTVTPTKPLTPSHVKFLWWMDVLYRSTSYVTEVDHVYHHRTFAVTHQVLRFWRYLDRTYPNADYAQLTDEEIGELYVAAQATKPSDDVSSRRRYAERVERYGWLHPVSVRVLELWEAQYRVLGRTTRRWAGTGRRCSASTRCWICCAPGRSVWTFAGGAARSTWTLRRTGCRSAR